jgi:hypothetical protein
MAKKLTPKERAEIYLQAAEYFEKKTNTGMDVTGFCDFIGVYHGYFSGRQFIEYELFRPRIPNLYWFPHTKEGKNQRLNALLFSYYMALDAKE